MERRPVTGIAAYLCLAMLAAVGAAVWLWPGTILEGGARVPAGVTLPDNSTVIVPFAFGEAQLDLQRDLYLLALVGGVLGACLYCIHALLLHVSDGTFDDRYRLWYVLHPFLGAGLGLGGAAVIRGVGTLLDPVLNLPTTPVAPFSVGILAGVSTRHSIQWLRDQSRRIFRSVAPTPSAPEVRDFSIVEESGQKVLRVTGKGLDKASQLYVDGAKLAGEVVEPGVLQVPLAPDVDPERVEVRSKQGSSALIRRR